MVARGMPAMMEDLHDPGQHLTIEPAANVTPGGLACDLASLSPKLRSSTPHPSEIESGWVSKHEELMKMINGYISYLKKRKIDG